MLKFFPAEALGGIDYLEAISPALPGVRYIPTGGINAENMVAWLKLPAVHAVAGSWLVSTKLLTEGNFDEITRLASPGDWRMLKQHARQGGKMSNRIVTFGEVMLRLKSPGHERLLQSPILEATFGGGEANVAVSLAQFGS